jgi:hypothetical protein
MDERLGRLYHLVMRGFVQTGQAPHYAELAAASGIPLEECRQLLHELTSLRFPNWLYPGTDLIAAFAPFSNLPNHIRVSVEGEQRWFAQCGLESLAISHLFPGRLVEIDAACLDCGERVRISMRDGGLVAVDPDGAVGHFNTRLTDWYADIGKT